LKKVEFFGQADQKPLDVLRNEVNEFLETVKVVDIKAWHEPSDEGLQGYRVILVIYEEA